MNPTIDILLRRKSIRVYEKRPIPDEVKDLILQATLRAPTAGNMMLYTIIEVEDQALKDRLAVTCDDQPFIATAPYVLLFLADYQRWYDYYLEGGVEDLCRQRGQTMRRPQEGDFLLACCDTLIAAHTAVVAAEALGVGSCYIGDIIENYETHRQMFNLPQYAVPVALVCFGYPTEEQANRQQPSRFPREFIVHRNAYQRTDAAELDRLMKPRNDQLLAHGPRQDGLVNVGQFNYVHKFSADFSIEMTRSVRALIESWNRQP